MTKIPERRRAPGTHLQGGPQSRFGRSGEEKNSLPLPGFPLLNEASHQKHVWRVEV